MHAYYSICSTIFFINVGPVSSIYLRSYGYGNQPIILIAMSEKMWGSEPFWGLGYDWDPDWVLTERQQELRATLIELCEKEMRANAKRSDDELLFQRRNLELLGEHGFLALTVPAEYGGLGENHVAFAMTCETIARYGGRIVSREPEQARSS